MQIGSLGEGVQWLFYFIKSYRSCGKYSLIFRKESAACDGNSRQRFSQLSKPIALGVFFKFFLNSFAHVC